MARSFLYGTAAIVLVGFVFLVIVFITMAGFGVAVVRSDHFATFVLLYWFIGAPVAMILVHRLATARNKADAD